MGFWNVNTQTAANFNRLGPWVDEIVGTNGNYQSLNSAIAAGKRKILIDDGAYLSAALTINIPTGGFIVSLGHGLHDLGSYPITIASGNWYLEGFQIDGATGVGILVSGGRVEASRIWCRNNSSHGFQITSADNDHAFFGCYFDSNGGDGLRIGSGASGVRVLGGHLYGNTGYGVTDQANSSILVGNRMDGNSSGAISGTPWIDVGNKKT